MKKTFKKEDIEVGFCFKTSVNYTYKIIKISPDNYTDLYCFENDSTYFCCLSVDTIVKGLNLHVYTPFREKKINEKNI